MRKDDDMKVYVHIIYIYNIHDICTIHSTFYG